MKNYETPKIKITAFKNDECVVASGDTPEDKLDNGGAEIIVPDDNTDVFN